ncbi:hypothetical protein TrVGV298_003473 [Trichoderma virens]|nr:hypothetical protein TrVGV298_003473 [Trichoderma virens]
MAPLSNTEGPTRPRADNVCLSCRRKKKKCDKALPKCLQCKKLHIQCVYEDAAESVPVIEEFRQLRKKIKLFEEMLVPGTSKVSGPTRSAAEPGPPETASQTDYEADLISRLEGLTSKLNVGEEVYQLLQSHPGEIYGASQIYFNNIHKWIPIMSQKLFYTRMTDFSRTKRPDFAILLLCILLSIHCPASDTAPEPLYRATRSIFWSLNASIDASLEMIQAGILLSCYEYGFGMDKECYKTIGICVRMGHWMELHNEKPPSDDLQYSDEWIRIAERCNLWWALVIRDRSTLMHDATFAKPYASCPDTVPEHLPFESFDLDPSFSRIGDGIITRDAEPGVFGYQAKAWRLFDRTVAFRHRVINFQSAGYHGEEKFEIDSQLQQLMRILVDQSGGATCGYCEPSAIVLVSLLLLHSRYPSVTAEALRKGEVAGYPPHCVLASSLAVKTIVRMVVDVAHTINNHYRKINIISFPPTYCHAIYRATLELISFRDDMDNAEWTKALETLREATWNYGRRWQAAAKHLQSVNDVLSGVLPHSPSTFNSFQPIQNDPCLVALLSK